MIAIGRGLFLFVTCAALADVAQAQRLQIPDNTVPVFSVYSTRDGLSDEIWNALGLDADGFVWAGSASSLARFDGYRWTMWNVPPLRGLVRDIERDDKGRLWAVFERGGFMRYDGHTWQPVGGSYAGARMTVVEGEQGNREYWLAHGEGLARLEGDEWRETSEPPPSSSDALCMTRTNTLFGRPRLWIGTVNDGLWYRELTPTPGPWRRFERPETAGRVPYLLRSEEGGREELWAATGQALVRLREDDMRTWSRARGEVPTDIIFEMVEMRDRSGERTIWVASRAGLLRVRGDQLDVLDRRHGLPSDVVRSIMVQHTRDDVDVLWLATEGGIARAVFGESPWQTVSFLGARDNGTLGLMFEPDGQGGQRLWIGSSREGLARLEHGTWRHFTHAAGQLPGQSVRTIFRLPDETGRMRRFVGIFGQGLLEIRDEGTIVAHETPWPLHPEEVPMAALARRYDDRLEWWFAARRSGVYRWRAGEWTHYGLTSDAELRATYALAEQVDRRGRSWLWAAGGHGLTRFDGETWTRVPVFSEPEAEETLSSVALLWEQGTHVLWVGSLGQGVARLDVTDPSHPRLLPAPPPPPDPTVYSVLPDSRSRLYICTNNGVQQLTPDGGRYTERIFRRRDGLTHDECNLATEFIDDQDRYWVGTLGGLSVFDPSAQRPAAVAQPKPLFVTALRAGDRDRVAAPDGIVRLEPETRTFRVEYALLTGLRESESRYRSHLLGYDAAPTEWSTEHARTFNALPPGRYELRIEARDYTGAAGRPISLQLDLAPHWYELRWLRALAGTILLIAVAAAAWSYERVQRRRQRRLEQEVAHRTAELNTANARLTELSYLDPLTGVANRRRLTMALDAAIERARVRHQPIGLILIDVDHFKDFNDQFGHIAGDAALRAVAQTIAATTRAQDLVARFGGEEFACLLHDADRSIVERLAERIRAAVEGLPPLEATYGRRYLTVSAGVFCRVPRANEDVHDLLAAADAALYEAKRQGRNRVVPVDSLSA